ncbi:MAG: 2-oxo-4-hydroxy-4-carboxy-5-ureidoimidazoline decarboxylase [Leptolyngbyaceae cyanobacterium MO_188.B28]|nr:2-oxo-4-hydroxy-4-carboxy-5-ureidoimidazoline decarboxylase [Leptolyngbyaceae cyanobacterium MO_188.B28]
MGYSIEELNQVSEAVFVQRLGAVFEETPAIAHRVWGDRPFGNVRDLHQKMAAVVRDMSLAEQLALIQAHPDLGSRVKMAAASVEEQAGVGFNRLTPEEYGRFQALNATYREKFGFPFVMAVKGQTKTNILAAFEARLENTKDLEIQQALSEITQIARFRLNDLID